GAVRSFFGADLVEYPPAAGAAVLAAQPAEDKAATFLAANQDLFRLQNINLRPADRREGGATESLRFRQDHHDIPVYGGRPVGGRQRGGRVASTVNKVDYGLAADLTRAQVRLTAEQGAAVVRQRLGGLFQDVATGAPTLYVYRHQPPPPADTPVAAP